MSETDKIAELKRYLSLIIDAAVPQGNGESIVPTEDLEDARAAVFSVQADGHWCEGRR